MKTELKRVNAWMKGGKKTLVQREVQRCIRMREREVHDAAGDTFRRSKRMQRVIPVVETKSMKRSGMAQQVPIPVTDGRGRYRAIKWLREATLKRAKKTGVPWGRVRRKELTLLTNELQRLGQGRHVGKTLGSEPLEMRSRTHRAAKANRVNSSRW